MTKQIEVFTDGSCLGNPGVGGYGAIIRGVSDGDFELSGGHHYTTNNRMEMSGVHAAFKKLNEISVENSRILVQTDSRLIVNTFTQNWKKKENRDLWAMIEHEMMGLVGRGNTIDWKWIKGHAGHTENERCDELAKMAAGSPKRSGGL